MKKNALKLVHLPTMKVFANWPTERTPLGYVQCLEFSPEGGYMAAGNDKGRVLLWKLRAFEDY